MRAERREEEPGHPTSPVTMQAERREEEPGHPTSPVTMRGFENRPENLTAVAGLCWDQAMTLRLLPYATRPGRLLGQLFSDAVVSLWTAVWVLVGLAVHRAIATIAQAGRQVEHGAKGVGQNLASAGNSAEHIPLVGGAVSKPLNAASDAARDIAGAGHSLDTTASWLAVLLALAVAAPPILAVAMPWLVLRLRFFRRKLTVTALAETPAGEQLLALRALANRPLRKLTTVSADPVGAWRREDPVIIHGLAGLELRSAGIAARIGA